MNILGISAFYHDSAACLVQDGRIVAAAQEERFTRKKHDYRFPAEAVQYCLREAGLRVEDLDHVAFYDKPIMKFERLIETWIRYAPRGFKQFVAGLPLWLKQKLHTPRELDQGLGGGFKSRYIFMEHHESHAASAFFPSPFDKAAVLTLDGVGEWTTASIGVGEGNTLRLTHELRFPHSLGLLYSAFTYFTGFRVNSGEYKLMGLAPYGRPIYHDADPREADRPASDDGSFRMDMSYFAYCHKDVMTSSEDGRALRRATPARGDRRSTQREMDIAASIQSVTEEIVLRIARHAHELTGLDDPVPRRRRRAQLRRRTVAILREGPFENVWIQPAAGDAGGALGAALFVWHQLLDKPRQRRTADAIDEMSDHLLGSLLGPRYEPDDHAGVPRGRRRRVHERFDDDGDLCRHAIAGHIAERAGRRPLLRRRMEFGPRALGNRSIMGDARSPKPCSR